MSLCSALGDKAGISQRLDSILEVFSKLEDCGIPTLNPSPLGGLGLHGHTSTNSLGAAGNHFQLLLPSFLFPLTSFPRSFRAQVHSWGFTALPCSKSCPSTTLLLRAKDGRKSGALKNTAFVMSRELRPWPAVCSFCTFSSSTAAGLGWGCCGQVKFGLQTPGHC